MASVSRETELNEVLNILREPKSVMDASPSSEQFRRSNEELIEHLKKIDEYSNR